MSMYEPIPEVKISAGEIKVDDVLNPVHREQYRAQADYFAETDVEYAFEDKVKEVVDGISRMLFEKNRKYGDAALNPARIFSKADATEQIKVRIDDKINRVKNAQDDEDEDVIADLIGYLILLTIARDNA